MSYVPNIDDCSYDEEMGAFYDSESGNYYTEDENGFIYEAGDENRCN